MCGGMGGDDPVQCGCHHTTGLGLQICRDLFSSLIMYDWRLQMQIVRVSSKDFYLLSHLTGPCCAFSLWVFILHTESGSSKMKCNVRILRMHLSPRPLFSLYNYLHNMHVSIAVHRLMCVLMNGSPGSAHGICGLGVSCQCSNWWVTHILLSYYYFCSVSFS